MKIFDDIKWKDPTQPLAFSYRKVHVWYGNCESRLFDYKYFLHTLSPEEKKRADRYKFDLHRNRFIMRRAVLRLILSKYVNESPGHLEISSNSFGKPEIIQRSGKKDTFFSCSHSQGVLIYAVGHSPAIGIDVEDIRKKAVDFDAVLGILYSKQERHNTFIQEGDKIEFYKIWTALEAYLKAIGVGFTQTLDNKFWIEFPIDMKTWKAKDTSWTIIQIIPEKDIVATLMIKIPSVIPAFYDISRLL